MKLQGLKINFLGDSITEGVGASSPEHIYLNVLKANAGLAEARNYGISGTRIARQTNPTVSAPRFDLDYMSRVQEMDQDADVVVVFGGTNDFGHGDAPMGTFDDRTPMTFYGACHLLMQELIERFPDSVIVIMTPLHRTGEDAGSKPAPQDKLVKYVNALQEVSAYYALPVLDLYRCSGIQPNVETLKERYAKDGLHPTDAGNARIAARLQGFLETL